MPSNNKKVYVHSRNANHEVVCGFLGNQRTYKVVEHVFECGEEDAVALFKHWDYDDRFGGQFRMPLENYRPATTQEIDAFLARQPELAAVHNAAIAQDMAKEKAELERRIAELNARLGTLAPTPPLSLVPSPANDPNAGSGGNQSTQAPANPAVEGQPEANEESGGSNDVSPNPGPPKKPVVKTTRPATQSDPNPPRETVEEGQGTNNPEGTGTANPEG